MTDEEQKKTEKPERMSRIAWPKAKYGLYLALFIIIVIVLILLSLTQKKFADKSSALFFDIL